MEEALTSREFHDAIEVSLRRFRRSYRWLELYAETEEVRDEVAARALEHLATFDPQRARPLSWLMGIACNVLRERARWIRDESARSVPQSSYTEEQWLDLLDRLSVEQRPAEEPDPVWQAMGRIDLDQRRILRLRFIEERPYVEIAASLGISEDAARARLCRALRRLRDLLTSESKPNERREGQ